MVALRLSAEQQQRGGADGGDGVEVAGRGHGGQQEPAAERAAEGVAVGGEGAARAAAAVDHQQVVAEHCRRGAEAGGGPVGAVLQLCLGQPA